MASAGTTQANELTLALPLQLKEQLQDAAASLGVPVGEYAVSILSQETSKILYGPPILKLSPRDSKRVLDALEDPDPPLNESLLEAIRDYRNRNVGDV